MIKSVIARLDALANRTGIPQLYEVNPRRRPMRWLPILSITVGTIGIVMTLAGAWFGETVVMFALLPSGWMPLLGPVKPLNWSKTVDERDIQVRSAAYLATLPVILIAAIILLAVLPWRVMMRLHGTDMFGMIEVSNLGLYSAVYLGILWNSIPTLYASLKWPEDEKDDD